MSSNKAREVIQEFMQRAAPEEDDFIDETEGAEQEGDPSLPAAPCREVVYVAAKPLISITHRKRKCITNVEKLNEMKVTKVGISNGGSAASSSVVSQSICEDVEIPEHQVAQHTTSLDDSDLSLSETDF